MRARFGQYQLRLIAVLLLSLSASLWLQGDHLHITDKHSVSEHCLVCQFGAAAAPAAEFVVAVVLASATLLVPTLVNSLSPARRLRPPARAPPLIS